MKLWCGVLNGLAITSAVVGFFGLFWALAWAWAIAGAAVLVILAEGIAYVTGDCGYSDTPCAPVTSRTVHTPHLGCATHTEKRPTWDTDIVGAPE